MSSQTDPQTAQVVSNLENADRQQGVPHGDNSGTTATVGHEGGHAPVPTLFGVVNATAVVSLAMLVFIGILLWKGVPRVIAGALDKQIADIRRQLDEARSLRAEAEALRDSYAAKMADAEGQSAAMLAHAQVEADALVAKANTDAAELVKRRGLMAQDKIASAERAALAEVRAKAADAAARAAATLIAQRHDAVADRALVNRTIAGLGRPN